MNFNDGQADMHHDVHVTRPIPDITKLGTILGSYFDMTREPVLHCNKISWDSMGGFV
jgi:hypothetical protein